MSQLTSERIEWAVSIVAGVSQTVIVRRADPFWELPLRAVELADGLLARMDPPHPQADALRETFAFIRSVPAMEGLGYDPTGRARRDAMVMLAAIDVLVDGPHDGPRYARIGAIDPAEVA